VRHVHAFGHAYPGLQRDLHPAGWHRGAGHRLAPDPALAAGHDHPGESLLLQALIALAIGGLTSFPGAAAGSVLVGLLQQFIIRYGQIGISLPFLAEPFKPTPPLVPASTVLLMVIILLALPQGLFGRKE
jgi:branched-subunit amino acid ABC-type transport system permease component